LTTSIPNACKLAWSWCLEVDVTRGRHKKCVSRGGILTA
jgi:hypothetical protein